MALDKLRQLDPDSEGITLPKGYLQVEGLLDDDGQVNGEHHLHVRHVGEGEWTIKLIDEFEM